MSDMEKELLKAIRAIHSQSLKGDTEKAMDIVGAITFPIVKKYKSK